MADSKISLLPSLATAADDDLLAIVDTSATETKKIAKSDLVAGLQAELVSGTNIKTINSTSLLGSGDITISGGSPAGTAGQIQFSDGSAFAADSNLFWDNTNKRLGVGTASPTKQIQVTTSTVNGVIYAEGGINSGVYFGNLGNGETFITNNGLFHTAFTRNGNVGIGTGVFSIPNVTARLQVRGTGATSATTSLLVQNSSGTELLKVADNGDFTQLNGNIWNIKGYSYFKLATALSNLLVNNQYGNYYGTPFAFGNVVPETSAHLQVESTTKGFLPPRMTTTQKNAISTPAAGLQLYDSTTSRPCVYTTAWESLTSSDSASPTAVYKFWSGTAAQYASLTPDSNTVYFVS